LLISSAVNGTSPLRRGNRSAVFAPQGVYRCAGPDDWCAISVVTDEHWKALTKAMGQADWGSDGRFATVSGRIRHHDEIDRKIEAWTQILPNTEIEFRLKAVGIPAERMRRINDLLESGNGATVFAKIEEPRVGLMLTTRLPFSLSSDSLPPARSAPSLGEHTAEILREWLNLSRKEIDGIKKQEALI
jgi:crotonobetainyl-CoA:carnitine CoA-transferase CaiB-like acyl-CoA transferase